MKNRPFTLHCITANARSNNVNNGRSSVFSWTNCPHSLIGDGVYYSGKSSHLIRPDPNHQQGVFVQLCSAQEFDMSRSETIPAATDICHLFVARPCFAHRLKVFDSLQLGIMDNRVYVWNGINE